MLRHSDDTDRCLLTIDLQNASTKFTTHASSGKYGGSPLASPGSATYGTRMTASSCSILREFRAKEAFNKAILWGLCSSLLASMGTSSEGRLPGGHRCLQPLRRHRLNRTISGACAVRPSTSFRSRCCSSPREKPQSKTQTYDDFCSKLMQSRLVLRRDRLIFDRCSKRYYWSVKGHPEPPFIGCLPIRREILNISQIAVTFHGIRPPFFVQT